MTSPSDKAEAERRYPRRSEIVPGAQESGRPIKHYHTPKAERAAYIAGREDVRAALPKPAPAPADTVPVSREWCNSVVALLRSFRRSDGECVAGNPEWAAEIDRLLAEGARE